MSKSPNCRTGENRGPPNTAAENPHGQKENQDQSHLKKDDKDRKPFQAEQHIQQGDDDLESPAVSSPGMGCARRRKKAVVRKRVVLKNPSPHAHMPPYDGVGYT